MPHPQGFTIPRRAASRLCEKDLIGGRRVHCRKLRASIPHERDLGHESVKTLREAGGAVDGIDQPVGLGPSLGETLRIFLAEDWHREREGFEFLLKSQMCQLIGDCLELTAAHPAPFDPADTPPFEHLPAYGPYG